MHIKEIRHFLSNKSCWGGEIKEYYEGHLENKERFAIKKYLLIQQWVAFNAIDLNVSVLQEFGARWTVITKLGWILLPPGDYWRKENLLPGREI